VLGVYIAKSNTYVYSYIHTHTYIDIFAVVLQSLCRQRVQSRTTPLRWVDDDVYSEYYTGKRFHINYSCLHVLRKTHKLIQSGISNEHKRWVRGYGLGVYKAKSYIYIHS
jgi:hypothetical protein